MVVICHAVGQNSASIQARVSLMHHQVEKVADVIRKGGVVAYPTEAVYGVGCDPSNPAALERLFDLKQRPKNKGLILMASSLEQVLPYITVSAEQQARLARTWPAAITFLVPPSDKVLTAVTGQHALVAVRVPDHPMARALAAAVGHPIISTSANLSGRPAPRNHFQVMAQLGNGLDALLVGDCDRGNKPSTIINLLTDQVIRP